MCAQQVCVVYVHMLVPVLVQFSLENSQVTFLLMVNVKSQSFSILTVLSKSRGRSVLEEV